MTSICVGAVASQVKAGLPTSIYISPIFMASILPVQLEWLRPFLPYIPDIFLDLDPFCQGEPPTQPTLTDATIAAVFAGGDFSAALVAGNLIQAALLNWYWYQVCECSSGTQPTAPTPQSDPGGLVAVNPPALVRPPAVLTCQSGTSPSGSPSIFAAFKLFGVRLTEGGGPPLAIPSGASLIRFTVNNTSNGATHKTLTFRYYPYPTATLENTPIVATNVATGASATFDVAVVPGAYGFALNVQSVDGSATTDLASATYAVYCGGQPGQVSSPCCPPDEILNGMIRQILQYVTLIQRQSSPFGYVYGANHATLSDNGTISVSGLVGCSVDITTLPDSYGRSAGDPDELFGLGWISMGTADGITKRRRLDADGVLFLPGLGGVFTSINYALSAGVVVSIRELVREP